MGHGRGPVIDRLGSPLAKLVDDSSADPQFEALLGDPAMKALLHASHAHQRGDHRPGRPRRHAALQQHRDRRQIDSPVRTPNRTTTRTRCPPGQGKILFDHLTSPKEFRLFTEAKEAEGHCEGMAPIVFWDAAFNWLDSLLSN